MGIFEYHKKTKHSYYSIRRNPNYIEWSKQSSPFKVYKNYIRSVELDEKNDIHRFIYYTAGINAKKIYPNMEYFLRFIPSAGALYPTEVYIQIRGVEGFLDGIYHFDIKHFCLKLLYQLSKGEGVEFAFEDRREIRGFIFLLSTIYYRSAWKYKDRAFRYSLLDAGHLLGAIEASAYLFDKASNIRYNFDKDFLNRSFGLGDREFFLSSAIVGKPLKQRVDRFCMSLEDINPPYDRNIFIEDAYKNSLDLFGCKSSNRYDESHLDKDRFEESIKKRRSIRGFAKRAITKATYESIMRYINRSILSDCDEEVSIYSVVNRVRDLKCGLYLNGKLLKEGDFSKKAAYLSLEQDLGGDSGVTIFLSSQGKNYQALYQKSGIIAHRLYLISEYLGLGCSGIGAYYDDEVCEFLDLDKNCMILYAIAFGN